MGKHGASQIIYYVLTGTGHSIYLGNSEHRADSNQDHIKNTHGIDGIEALLRLVGNQKIIDDCPHNQGFI